MVPNFQSSPVEIYSNAEIKLPNNKACKVSLHLHNEQSLARRCPPIAAKEYNNYKNVNIFVIAFDGSILPEDSAYDFKHVFRWLNVDDNNNVVVTLGAEGERAKEVKDLAEKKGIRYMSAKSTDEIEKLLPQIISTFVQKYPSDQEGIEIYDDIPSNNSSRDNASGCIIP